MRKTSLTLISALFLAASLTACEASGNDRSEPVAVSFGKPEAWKYYESPGAPRMRTPVAIITAPPWIAERPRKRNPVAILTGRPWFPQR